MIVLTWSCIRCGAEMGERGLQCEKCRNEDRAPTPAPTRTHATPQPSPGTSSARQEPGLFPFPGVLQLQLPWSALASDNLRKGVVGQANREKSAEYREALAKARSELHGQYSGELFEGPAVLHARFWVPNDQRRDLSNFAKLILDALVGIVLSDDRWQVLRSQTWEGCGIDVDRPRCELTVSVHV